MTEKSELNETDVVNVPLDDKPVFEDNTTDAEGGNHVQRKLRPRHLQMIAIGGTIGTGIFLSSGASIATAGPGGALVSYLIVSLMVYFIVMSLGEMSALIPVSGAFTAFGTRFVDPALGFTLGWNYWAQWAISIPSELTAAGLIIQFWNPNFPIWASSLIIIIVLFCVNLIGVRIYGETEYWLSLIKVLTVIIFIIVGILVDAGAVGGRTIGGSNWQTPGAAFYQGASGIFQVLLFAFYSFGGTELVGIAAGESENPAKNVPKAVKNTFWRIFLFFILTIIVIGLCIPYDNQNLLNAASNSDITVAPFTLVLQIANLNQVANVMNAVILTAVFSATNSCFYASSRTLMALAQEGMAPRIFAYVDKRGVPVWSLVATTLVACIAFLTSLWGGGVVFTWLINLTGISGLLTWMSISVIHLRFRQAYRAQGRDIKDLPYRAALFPLGPIMAIIIALFIFAGEGWSASQQESVAVSMVGVYIGVVVFFGLYFGYKIIKRTHLVNLLEADFETNATRHRGEVVEPEAETKWWQKAAEWIA